jgi:hypothetical protein
MLSRIVQLDAWLVLTRVRVLCAAGRWGGESGDLLPDLGTAKEILASLTPHALEEKKVSYCTLPRRGDAPSWQCEWPLERRRIGRRRMVTDV